MAYGFDVSALPAYVEQHATALKARAFFSSKSIRTFEVLKGIKGPTTLNKIAADLVLQAGACGWSAGDGNLVTLTQQTLTPGSYKINMPLCVKDLEAKFTRSYLPAGQANDSLPTDVEGPFMEALVGTFGEIIEKAIWQGDTDSGTANLNKFDGFVKILDVQTSANAFNPASSAWTVATSVDIIAGVIAAIPSEVIEKEDAVVAIGLDKFRQYTAKLMQLNLFHYPVQPSGEYTPFEMIHPGTNVKIVAFPGLNTINRIYAGQSSNFVIGVDDAFENTHMELFYSKDNDEMRFILKGMMGVQDYFPTQIVRQVTT